MSTPFKKRLLRTALLSLLALVVGAGIAMMQIKNDRALPPPPKVAGGAIGGDYELVDHTGKTVTQDEFSGRHKLIYFGFTSCPAICPTELTKVTKALEILGEEGADIQPIFITIDPARDSVDVMKGYISLFTPRLVGLTGSQAQIDETLKNYRVFARKVEDESLSDYTMDHSSFIYLMSPDDELISIYRIQDDAEFIAKDVRAKI